MRSPRPPSGARVSRAIPVLLFLLLVLAAYADPLFTRRNFIGRDLVPYNLPLEKAVHDAWARGRLPVWFPEVSGGRPLMPNPNAGAFYPVRPALAAVPFPLAMRIYPILHWAAAGVGMIVLLRALSVSAGGALVAASTYAFSGVMVSEIYYSNFQPGVTLLPWSLWALVRGTPSRVRRVLVLALVYALMMLAGDVITTGIAIGSGLLWIATEVAREGRRRAAGDLAAALALAVLLAAPQIVSTALLVPETHRAVIGMKLAETFHFSVSPWRLLELLVPYPFGAVWSQDVLAIWGNSALHFLFATLYVGAFALLALVAISRPPLGKGTRFALVLAVTASLLAVLPSFAPRAMLAWSSPIPLRYPEKFCVALALALAVAAGLALDRFREPPRPRGARGMLAAGVALTLLAGAATLFPDRAGRLAAAAVQAPSSDAAGAGRHLPGALAEGGLYWMATLVALDRLRRPGPWSIAGLALLALVPVAANRKIALADREETVFTPTPFAHALARRDPRGEYRTLDESSYRPPSAVEIAARPTYPGGSDYARRVWFLHTQALWGRGTVFNSDLDVGDLSRVDSLRRLSSAIATLPGAGAFFGSFALRYGIRWRDQEPMAGYRPFGHDGLQTWDENPDASADIRLLGKWREERGALEALREIPRLQQGEVVLETGGAAAGSARPGIARVLEKSPELLRLEVSSPDPTWLFVLRGFWSYRTVLLDGQEVDPVPAQLAFTAVPIPAGDHRLEWKERVPGWEVSRWGPLLFTLTAAWLLARERRGSRAAG
ncbi:MAG: hypothetical protein ACRD3M_13585 [Thermoanaerobaculia bacterium]